VKGTHLNFHRLVSALTWERGLLWHLGIFRVVALSVVVETRRGSVVDLVDDRGQLFSFIVEFSKQLSRKSFKLTRMEPDVVNLGPAPGDGAEAPYYEWATALKRLTTNGRRR
jgi:hypothetical protein